MARGGYRPGAGRKPNPNKPKVVATTRLPDRKPLAEPLPAEPKTPQAIDPVALANSLPQLEEMLNRYARKRTREQPRSADNSPFRIPWFPGAAKPKSGPLLAMDNLPVFADAGTAWINGGAFAAEGLVFLGYPYLAELAQRPEYRTMAETIADDATREWISFDVTGDEKTEREARNKDPEGYEERQNDPDEMKKRVKAAGKEDRVKALIDDQEKLEVRDRFYWASTFDSWMGRSHFYLQIGDADFDRIDGEMSAPIGNSRDDLSKGKVSKESPLKYIKTVEPVWTYPQAYNAINPLAPDWYNPQQWYVMGRNIHISRLPTFVTRPVPDMLKPAYAFGGLPLSQIAKPYVDIWLDTRQSVADLIKSFSVMVLQTDLATQTAPGNASALLARVLLFNMLRDNQGLFVTNKNTEEFKNVSAPLSGLHELQAQSQEHMLSVARIPAVKFTGIQPAGLNASSDGEIKVYDDTIKAYQKRSFDPNLTRIINFEMLSLFGEVDPEITHRWNPLRQLTDAEKAEQKKKEADWYGVLVDMGAFSPAEVRGVVINDPESPFAGLDPDDVPEPPQPEPGEGEPEPGDEEDGGEGPETAGGPGGAQDSDPFGGTERNRYHDVGLIADDEFKEDDHPRDEGGKFTSGGGGGGKGSRQHLQMPQFGLTPSPSSWSYKPRPFPKASGKPEEPSSVVVFSQANEGAAKELNGKAFSKWSPPKDWADVAGQAKIDEPPVPKLPKGMSLSSGVLIREPDGRVWMVRPSNGYGGYDQTFPKGGVEDGLSPQANAIKEAYEESGLKVKITGFAGDYEGDTSVTRYYFAEREGGDPRDAGWESEGVILAPPDKLKDFVNRSRDREIAKALNPTAPARAQVGRPELDPADLTKQGGQLGSNEGGVFTNKAGEKFYIKRPSTKEHVKNELAAARLYQLAGVNTLDYRPVKGGNHVATKWENLDKNRISQMSDAEKAAAAGDFAVHAWLANWDAAGTGGDNQGVRGGKPVTLDVGGSLRYRAQGGPKGTAFGKKVSEIDSMRDKSKSPDAARLFGKMTDEQLADSASRVTSIPDAKIREAAGDDDLAEVLIARKNDLAKRFGLAASDEAMVQAADEAAAKRTLYVNRPLLNGDALRRNPALDEAQFEESKHPRAPDGKFTSGAGSSGGGEAKEMTWAEVKGLLTKKPIAGSNYRKALVKAIALAPNNSTEKLTLVKNLAMSWAKTGANAFEKGDFMTGQKIGKKLSAISKEHGNVDLFEATQVLADAMKKAKAVPAPPSAQKVEIKEPAKPAPQAPQEPESWTSLAQIGNAIKAAGKHIPPPTPQELEKAKKTVALQMSYVPGSKPEIASGEPMKKAEALLKDFNDKWAGKSVLPSALPEKVNDFKLLGFGIAALHQVEKKHMAAIAAKAKEEQAAAAKKAAEKAAAEAKAAAEKNKELMDSLGIGQDQAEGLAALAKMLGQSNADLALAFKSYEATAKGYGYPISGIEAATIMSYSNGTYGKVNEALRSGSWTPAQHVYVSMVNKALSKMPKHAGSEANGTHLIRNTHLTPEQIAFYTEGHIVQEKALMSTSTKKPNGVFSGNVRFVITSKGKRGASIKKLSHYGSEDEVIFAAKTFFKVNKVEKLSSKLSTGADTVIHLEEWEDLD